MRILMAVAVAAGLALVSACGGSGSGQDFNGTWRLTLTPAMLWDQPVDLGFVQDGTTLTVRQGFRGLQLTGTCNPDDGTFSVEVPSGAAPGDGVFFIRGTVDGDTMSGTHGNANAANPSGTWTGSFVGQRTSRSLPEPTAADAWDVTNVDWTDGAGDVSVTGTIRNATTATRHLKAVTCQGDTGGGGDPVVEGSATIEADVAGGAALGFTVALRTGGRGIRGAVCWAVE